MQYDLTTIAQLCAATRVGENVTIDSVVIDSRSFTIDSATLFAAIRTESRDGPYNNKSDAHSPNILLLSNMLFQDTYNNIRH